jgi:RimJ/RimL family protein N-acetyltransferase
VACGITDKNERDSIGTTSLWHFSENNTIAKCGFYLSLKFKNKGIIRIP